MADDFVYKVKAISDIDRTAKNLINQAIIEIGGGKPLDKFTQNERREFENRKLIIEELATRTKAGK